MEIALFLDQCHWVCKVVVGRGRGRSPLKATQTLHKLRDCAKRQLMQAATSSALAEDPLCIIDGADIDGRLLETPVKRRRPMIQTFFAYRCLRCGRRLDTTWILWT